MAGEASRTPATRKPTRARTPLPATFTAPPPARSCWTGALRFLKTILPLSELKASPAAWWYGGVGHGEPGTFLAFRAREESLFAPCGSIGPPTNFRAPRREELERPRSDSRALRLQPPARQASGAAGRETHDPTRLGAHAPRDESLARGGGHRQ